MCVCDVCKFTNLRCGISLSRLCHARGLERVKRGAKDWGEEGDEGLERGELVCLCGGVFVLECMLWGIERDRERGI